MLNVELKNLSFAVDFDKIVPIHFTKYHHSHTIISIRYNLSLSIKFFIFHHNKNY